MNTCARRLKVTLSLICGTAMAGILLVAPAQAQGQLADDGVGLADGEILVTAQRRSESIQTTPIAISVVTGDEMLRNSISGVEEVMRDLPSVEIRKAPPGASIYIRGIATQQ